MGVLVVVAAAFVGLTAQAASAGTVQVSGGEILYKALPGETNTVKFEETGTGVGVLVTDSTAPVTAKWGCATTPLGALCNVPIEAPLTARMGDGNDTAYDARYPVVSNVNLFGGAGNDTLSADSIYANFGDIKTLDGGSGNDTIQGCCGLARVIGGSGADTIHLTEAGGVQIDAGTGNDTINFEGYGATDPAFPTSISLGAGKDDLTLGDDTFRGPGRSSPYSASSYSAFVAGDATIDGGADRDVVRLQTSGASFDLNLSRGIEWVVGTDDEAGDLLIGDGSANTLDGGAGPDVLIGNGGADRLNGGSGDDRLLAGGDGASDVLSCGSGTDLFYASRADDVWGSCETAFTP
jgi:Ca2+-binding RTX toxin-like protein